MENQNNQSIKNSILSSIKKGEISMKPRWHFVLSTIWGIVAVVLLILSVLYLASLVLFSLNNSGAIFAPTYGLRGINIFIQSLPWLLIMATIIFLVLLEVLVRKYSFAYKKPALYSLAAILVLTFIGGIILSRLSFHERIFRFAEDRHTPYLEHFYSGYVWFDKDDLHKGTIIQITENGFVVETISGEQILVSTSTQTRLPKNSNLKVGDEVVVLGDVEDSTIESFGVEKVEPNRYLPHAKNIKINSLQSR